MNTRNSRQKITKGAKAVVLCFLSVLLLGAFSAQAQSIAGSALSGTGNGNGWGKGGKPSPTPTATPKPTVADPFWDPTNGTGGGTGTTTPNGTWSTSVAAWNPLADGTGVPAVWSNGDAAVFSAGTDATGSYTVTVSGAVSASTLTIEEGQPTFSGTSTPSLTLSGGLTVNSGAGSVTFGSSLPISISATQSWTNNSAFNLLSIASNISSSATTATQTLTVAGAGNTTISGIISNGGTGGTIALVKNNGGTLTLSGANTYSGGTTWGNPASQSAGGIISVGISSVGGPGSITSGPLGTGTFTVRNSGTAGSNFIQSTDSTTRTISNAIVIAGSGTGFNTGGTGDLIFDGTVSLGTSASRTFSIGNTNTTFSGVISGTGSSLTKAGAGTLILSGANTYSGGTNINAGTVLIGVSNVGTTSGALGPSTAAVNLGDTVAGTSNASLLTNGAFTFSNNITVRSGNSGTATIGGNTANSSTFSGAISLNKDLTVTAVTSGTVNLTGSISNQTGTNTVNVTGAGTSNVVLNNSTTSNQFAPTTIAVNSGTLSLGAANQIGDSTNLTLGGGKFNTGGFNEVNGAAGSRTPGMGALTLTANSTIDFGAGASVIEFASLGAHTPVTGADLAILNWTGTQNLPGGTDQLLFAGVVSDFTSKYDQSDVSFNGLVGYNIFQITPNYYEVTMIPEPSTWVAAGLACLSVAYLLRRRLAALTGRA